MAKKTSMRSKIVTKRRTAGELVKAIEDEEEAKRGVNDMKKAVAALEVMLHKAIAKHEMARSALLYQVSQLVEQSASSQEPEADEEPSESSPPKSDSITQSEPIISMKPKQGQGPKP